MHKSVGKYFGQLTQDPGWTDEALRTPLWYFLFFPLWIFLENFNLCDPGLNISCLEDSRRNCLPSSLWRSRHSCAGTVFSTCCWPSCCPVVLLSSLGLSCIRRSSPRSLLTVTKETRGGWQMRLKMCLSPSLHQSNPEIFEVPLQSLLSVNSSLAKVQNRLKSDATRQAGCGVYAEWSFTNWQLQH